MTISPATTSDLGPDRPAAPAGMRVLGALLWRRRLVVTFVLLLMASVLTAGLLLAEREYTATARVAVTPPAEQPTSPASYGDLLGTVADVADSWPLLADVSSEIGDRTSTQLREQVRGDVVTGTVVVQVSVTDTDPERAAEIANAVVAALPEHDPSDGSFVFRVTEPAAVPDEFSSPDVPLTVLAGCGLAVLLAVAAAAAADRVLRTVRTPEEMTATTGAPVLGVVTGPEDAGSLPATTPDAPEFQSLRALRVALEFAAAENPTRLVVVAPASGADPWSGWLEVNLAAALAEVGHRVLLVDADRDVEPGAALAAPDEPGLYDVLAGSAALETVLRAGPVGGVDVLPLGNAHLAAPSLLEMRFRRLVEETGASYDVVLVHSGPISASEDARIMAIHGALLLTVPAGRVHPRHLQRAADHLRKIRIRLLGGVLVETRRRRTERAG